MTQENYIEIYRALKVWCDERRLSVESQRAGLMGNLCEELAEYYRAQDDYERVDALCDIAVFALNAVDNEKRVMFLNFDADFIEPAFLIFNIVHLANVISDERLNILAVGALHMILSLGFKPRLCMSETIKEISSRIGAYDESVGKWVKDKSDEARAKWYKADYQRCKL